MKIKSMLFFAGGVLMVGLIVVTIFSKFSSAFEPKLLWKKEIPSRASEISLARKSGDLIFIHGEKHNKITILDKKGNTQLQLGPDLERTFAGTSLSDDGRYFTYSSYYQMLVEYRKGPLNYIHYLEKNGKELWRKELLGYTIISPDGKTIFAGWPEMESGYSYFLDSSGKILRKIGPVGEIDGNIFSPDSNYFLLSEPYDFLYSRDGTLVWKKDFGFITSISDNADYIGFEKYKEGTEGGLFFKGEDVGGIYDREANLIYKGRARVSGNGKIAIIHYENRIELLKLPEKIVFNQFPIRRLDYPYMQYSPEAFNSRISYNGKYIAILGKRVDRNTPDNLYIIDVENASLWEYKLEEIQRSDGLRIEFTDEGKYLLFVHIKPKIEKSFIYYFELY